MGHEFVAGEKYQDHRGEYTAIEVSEGRLIYRYADGVELVGDAEIKWRIHRNILLERRRNVATSPDQQSQIKMSRSMSEMALRCYGYGRWDAPYWFIGPEQGQGAGENDDLGPRLRAWRELGARELDDCEEFSVAINEHSWHREGKLQNTWRPLILLLMTFLNKPNDKESLRAYQRQKWGRTNGETCVIELSGLAANNLAVPRDRETYREQRIEVIRRRMAENRPQLVVMYGTTQRASWEKIAGSPFPLDDILISDGTIMTVTEHPVKHRLTNAYWEERGEQLRRLSSSQTGI